MDKYSKAVSSIPCPRMSCQAPIGKKCPTSSEFHAERKIKAAMDGIWEPLKALQGEYGSLAGCPLAAIQPIEDTLRKSRARDSSRMETE